MSRLQDSIERFCGVPVDARVRSGRNLLREVIKGVPELRGVLEREGVDVAAVIGGSRANAIWTDEDLRDLGEMLESGWTEEECAQALGRSTGAVRSKRRALKRGRS